MQSRRHHLSSIMAVALAPVLGAALTLAQPGPAAAQDFTGKTIRVLVGLAPGGATDVMARLISQKMSENMKATVLVENKPGGNFIPVLRELTGAAPDGLTLLFISTSNLITQPLHGSYPFDLTKLAPVTEVATGPLILVTRPTLPIHSVKDLVDYAKKNPGKLSFGAGGGTGSSLYFALELLKSKTGIQTNYISYRGAGPALNDLLGGHIDAMFDAMPVMVEQAKMGKVRPLAVTSKVRSKAVPDVPTMIEAGIPDYNMPGWFGILAPEGTPPAVTQALRNEVAKAMTSPDVIKTMDLQGMLPRATQPNEWRDYLKSELATYSKMIKDANLKLE